MKKKPVLMKILNLIKYNDPTKRFKICHQLFFYVYRQELFFFLSQSRKNYAELEIGMVERSIILGQCNNGCE